MTLARTSSLALASLALPALLAVACSSSVTETSQSSGGGGQGSSSTSTSSTGSAMGGGGGTGGTAADCPQAASMLDVSKAPGAGASYPKPTLSAQCTATTFVVTSNDIPPYTFVQTTPNPLQASNKTYEIPRNPVVAAQKTDLPLLGVAGFAVNGLPFFGPNEAAQPAEEAYGDPVYNGLMDPCLGHTSPQEYHYHSMLEKCLIPAGLVDKPWMNDDPAAGEASPIIGWALDGFPIYGPRECADAACTSVVVMESGYAKTGDPKTYAWKAYTWQSHAEPTYLDACNGHTGPKGDYHYHATSGFPYIIGCYQGTPMGGGTMMGGMDGGTMMGGMDGGTMTGPKTCSSAADCTGACPQGSLGCTCGSTPMGMMCVPTCNTTADCPAPPMGQVTCKQGACLP
ncbi:MAG: YHYH protein [Minicystis sp.]